MRGVGWDGRKRRSVKVGIWEGKEEDKIREEGKSFHEKEERSSLGKQRDERRR